MATVRKLMSAACILPTKKIDNINRWTENTDIANALKQNKAMTNAELMSLGYINANKLVFEGERVVIDMDRLSGLDTTKTDALTIVSKPYDDKSVGDNRKYDVVLGSSTPENAKKAYEITERYPNVHGCPVHMGDPAQIGIKDIMKPDYGDPVEIREGEIPVFWACGVTPQAAVENAKPPIVITHAPGHMFITDIPNAELNDFLEAKKQGK